MMNLDDIQYIKKIGLDSKALLGDAHHASCSGQTTTLLFHLNTLYSAQSRAW